MCRSRCRGEGSGDEAIWREVGRMGSKGGLKISRRIGLITNHQVSFSTALIEGNPAFDTAKQSSKRGPDFALQLVDQDTNHGRWSYKEVPVGFATDEDKSWA